MDDESSSGSAPNLPLLVTPIEIRNALRGTYLKLKEFDMSPQERERTKIARRKLWEIGPKVCAACGKEKGEDGITLLAAAHLNALEECGQTTQENLLPLCIRDKTMVGSQLGCHTLFDEGYMSVSEMRNVRRRWARKQVQSVRSKIEDSWRKHANAPSSMVDEGGDEIQSLITQQKYPKAIEKIKEKLVSPYLAEDERFHLRIKLMEVCRRRPAKGSLEYADELRKELFREKIPSRLCPWFHYESGYISMLLGDLVQAEREFEESRQALNPKDQNYSEQWVAATVLIVQIKAAKLACGKKQKHRAREWNNLESTLESAEYVALKSKEVHGLRWIANCKWDRVRLYVARDETELAENLRAKAYTHWESMTAEVGWDAAFRTSINAINGIVLSSSAKKSSEAREALKYLSRAIVVILGKARQQHEGIRDVLFATANALRLLNDNSLLEHARRLEEVAARVRDGSSWRHPYFIQKEDV